MAKRRSWCLFVSEANVCVGAAGCAAAFQSDSRAALLPSSAGGYRTHRQRAGAPCVSHGTANVFMERRLCIGSSLGVCMACPGQKPASATSV